MPLLGAMIAALIGSLTAFFAKYVTKRLAVGAALVAVLLTLSAAMLGALYAAASGLTAVFPTIGSPGVAWGLYFVSTTAMVQMMVVVFATELVISGYSYQKQGAKLLALIS